MKAIILLNGEPHVSPIIKDGYVFCCDGAYDWAKGKIQIDENLGDFDSLGYLPEPPPEMIYPSEKNYTDGEIAIYRAVERGYDEIAIYGGGGRREDHFLGNLHLLYAAHQKGVKAVLYTNRSYMFLGEGRIEFNGLKEKTLSILPFGANAHIIESAGLYYPLEELDLNYGSTRGVSNVCTDDRAHILSKGVVLIVVNNEVS